MPYQKRYTYSEAEAAAKACRTKTEFRETNPGLYKKAWRSGWLDEICTHMQDQRTKWTEPHLREIAQRFRTKSEFQKQEPRAFHAARDRGLLDKICKHMKPALDTFYLCRIKDTQIFKPGVTSLDRAFDRIEELKHLIEQPIELVFFVHLPKQARNLEKKVLTQGEKVGMFGTSSDEFRVFQPDHLEKTLQLVSQATQLEHQ